MTSIVWCACRPAPKPVERISGRLEAALGLAADLLVHVQLRGPQLIPLLRVAGSALAVPSLPVLQVKAAGEGVQMFCSARVAVKLKLAPWCIYVAGS